MDFRSRAVLMAAIEEKRELVQSLYDWGLDELGSQHYEQLRELRARMREASANARRSDPGTDGNSPAV